MNEKFVQHEATGLPVRIPPYLRRELARGDRSAMLQLDLIAGSKVIGERSPEDTLAANLEENLRLRRVARRVSQELVRTALDMGAKCYFTFVHGSVARGLVRSASSEDPSDVDVDLVVDGVDILYNDKQAVRANMKDLGDDLGVKVDTYVYTLEDLKRDGACCAKRMLEGSSYTLANAGSLFEEARSYGLEALSFFGLNKRVRARVKDFVAFCEKDDYETALKVLGKNEDGSAAVAYVGRDTDGSIDGLTSRIVFLKTFINLTGGKANGKFYSQTYGEEKR